ncbi:hypothetical protein [Sinomonas sp. R1AF57]|uniref:hypothetical protein n=1 Tax=Sinomonas sp. R1AF57 TaxID=2020377 RepID=UPI000B61B6CD|nr:hypothetical protein [Sinomonas sp. R1AF57]ASN51110.1 hypothetical protein CGQ25_02665 [Sinomonas sp. R1AF57]
MFDFNLQTAVFFGTVALGALLFGLGVLAFLGTTLMVGAFKGIHQTAEAAQERLRRERSPITG